MPKSFPNTKKPTTSSPQLNTSIRVDRETGRIDPKMMARPSTPPVVKLLGNMKK